MNLDLKAKFGNLLSMRFTKLIIGIVVVAIVATVALTNKTVQTKLFGKKAAIAQNLATVKKGSIQVLVSGSGPIYFTNSSKLYSKINATVTAANFKAGDKVKKGDVIYTFDTTDAQSAIDSNQNALQQSQVAAAASNEAVSQLAITAPITGQVTNIAVNAGDTVQKGGTVFTLTDTSKLKALLPFNSADIAKIAIGQTAEVNLSSLMQSVKGTVTYVSSQSVATDSGAKLYTVEIQMNNPGALNGGMTVSADIQTSKGTVSSSSTALLDYVNKQTVISQTGGTVQSISAVLNQKVNSGSTIMTMQSDDIIRAQQSSNLAISGSQDKLNSTLTALDNYKIIAPYDGIITALNNKVGDTVTPGEEVADVADPTHMEFDVPVDELDVAKVAVGQKTSITVDALPNTTTTPVNGEVATIPVTGTAVSGVTTFPITINIDDNLGILKGGMNANADIMVSNRQNILYVPIEAITKIGTKNYVWLKGNGTGGVGNGFQGGGTGTTGTTGTTGATGATGNPGDTGSSTTKEATVSTKISGGNATGSYGNRTNAKSGKASKTQSYYYNAIRTEVQVGANNDTDIEITSGLNEGDVVILPQTKAASTKAATSTGGMGGGGGARSGGGF